MERTGGRFRFELQQAGNTGRRDVPGSTGQFGQHQRGWGMDELWESNQVGERTGAPLMDYMLKHDDVMTC